MQPFPYRLLRRYHSGHEGGHRLLQFLNRCVLALRHELRHAGGQTQQLEHGAQGRDVPLLGALDVLEVGEFIYRRGCEDRHIGGIELLAGDGEHQFAGVDEARQQYDHPFRLQPVRGRRQILDILNGVDELCPVEDLPRPFRAQRLDDVPSVLRTCGIEPVTVEQFQGVEDPCCLLRL